MSRYIDAEAFDKLLESRELWLLNEVHDYGMAGTIRGVRDLLEVQPTADVAPVSRWIPVAERLPEKASESNASYITDTVYVVKGGEQYIGYFHIYKYDGSAEFRGVAVDEIPYFDADEAEVFPADDIDFWMPLPEPLEVQK